jgi:hypothetical protein
MGEGLLPRAAGGWSGSGQSYLHFDREKDVPLSVVSNLGMGSFAVVDAVAYGSKLLARKKLHSYNSRVKAKTEGGLEFAEVLRVEREEHEAKLLQLAED